MTITWHPRNLSRINPVAIPITYRISFAIDELRRKDIVLQNVRLAERLRRDGLSPDGKVKVDFMVTHVRGDGGGILTRR